MTTVLVVGIAVVDFIFTVESFPTTADKFRADGAEVVGGGCAANAAVAISRLGGRAQLGARVGEDLIGDLIVSGLDAEGVQTDLIHRAPGARSSFSSVYVDRSGERQIVNFPGAGLGENAAWMEGPPTVDAVLADTRWTSGAVRALDIALEQGVPGIVDGEAPIDPAVVERASHIAFSVQGLRSLTTATAPAEGLEEIRPSLGGWGCVTDGENGVFYTGANGIEHIPAFTVEVVDTLAAGDIWHGAFALQLAAGEDEETAIRFANAVAALKCTRPGGRAGTPNRAEVNAFLLDPSGSREEP
ncbi:MAG: sugar kinase [Acidimicrobiales bacterium]|nr:sugar kinase [Acidimicrobiales bacterium]